MNIGDKVTLIKDISSMDMYPEYHTLPKQRIFAKGSKAIITEVYTSGGIIKSLENGKRLMLFDFNGSVIKED